MMVDTLMMLLCMHSPNVVSATLTPQRITAASPNWGKLSEKAGSHEVNCGSRINCGPVTTDIQLQERPALTPAQRSGLSILVSLNSQNSANNLLELTCDGTCCIIIAICSHQHRMQSVIFFLRSVPNALAGVTETWLFQQGDES